MKTKTKKEYCQWHETMETPAECATKPTTEATHTPTPSDLEIVQDGDRFEIHAYPDDERPHQMIASFFDKEMAELFLRAVNSHEALLSLIKEIKKQSEAEGK